MDRAELERRGWVFFADAHPGSTWLEDYWNHRDWFGAQRFTGDQSRSVESYANDRMRQAFEEAARIAEAMISSLMGKLSPSEAIAAAIRARALEVTHG